MTNGTTYAIGVAAYDNLGNVGPLSTMICVTPGPIDDFFSVYRDAGGKAGGCELSTGSATPSGDSEGAGLLVGLGALGLIVVRRQRRLGAKSESGSRRA